MLISHILVAVLWILYGVLHSVLASLSVKSFFQKKLGHQYKHYRLVYNVIAFIALAGIIVYQFTISSVQLFSATILTKIAGGLITASGLIIMLICIKKYFISLSGLRSLFKEEQYTELIISGIHRYVRHPLYGGTFIFIWGLWLIFPTLSFLITDVVITAYTLIGIQFEEKKLVKDFGEQYTRYQKEVPKLIPRF